MKHVLGMALLLTFVGAVLFFAPAGEAGARTLMPQNSNSSMTMQGDDDHSTRRRHRMRKHHRMTRRHHRMMRRHHWHHRHMSNRNHQ